MRTTRPRHHTASMANVLVHLFPHLQSEASGWGECINQKNKKAFGIWRLFWFGGPGMLWGILWIGQGPRFWVMQPAFSFLHTVSSIWREKPEKWVSRFRRQHGGNGKNGALEPSLCESSQAMVLRVHLTLHMFFGALSLNFSLLDDNSKSCGSVCEARNVPDTG